MSELSKDLKKRSEKLTHEQLLVWYKHTTLQVACLVQAYNVTSCLFGTSIQRYKLLVWYKHTTLQVACLVQAYSNKIFSRFNYL